MISDGSEENHIHRLHELFEVRSALSFPGFELGGVPGGRVG
jgi:hypothetical protein